jgi:hypothetical protein
LAVKTKITVESLTEELQAIAIGAAADKQWGAARGAVETKAKLHGLLVERKESGAPGDFSGLKSPEEVIALISQELGPAAAKLLEGAIDAEESDEPRLSALPPASDDAIN